MSRISNFEGDKDNVDEELDSESDLSSKIKGRDSISPGFSSDSKQFRLSLTPRCNIITSNRDENRIFSDLSAKVANMNPEKSINNNPF